MTKFILSADIVFTQEYNEYRIYCVEFSDVSVPIRSTNSTRFLNTLLGVYLLNNKPSKEELTAKNILYADNTDTWISQNLKEHSQLLTVAIEAEYEPE